jgi:hypothetical protein
MEMSDIRKMKDLEIENSRLKRLVAQYALENEAMREVSSVPTFIGTSCVTC